MIRHLRLLVAVLFCLAIFWMYPPPSSQTVSPTRSHIEEISANSVFVYRAYLDQRGDSPKLRVLAINRCHRENESVIHAETSGERVGLTPVPIEGRCPWHWADGCSLNAYIHEIEVPAEFQAKSIRLHGLHSSDILPVYSVETAVEQGLTICVPPMYWYTDWTKLILFVEWWRRQQTVQFIFYHQSSTKHVKRVLDYYVAQDWATIIPWPLLPSSASFQPNDEVYRLGHSLAHNDCLLRTKTEFMALVDIDELIQPMNTSLSEYMFQQFNDNSSFGAILFPHRVALYSPPLAPSPFRFEDVDFSGVGSVVYKDIKGPGKAIVQTNLVDRISTHGVNSFRDESWIQGMASGAFLLHNRYNYVGVKTNHSKTVINITGNPNWFQAYLIDRKEAIFPTGADFKEETQRSLGACLASWRSSQGNCKAPATGCRKTMRTLEDWIEDTSKAFTII